MQWVVLNIKSSHWIISIILLAIFTSVITLIFAKLKSLRYVIIKKKFASFFKRGYKSISINYTDTTFTNGYIRTDDNDNKLLGNAIITYFTEKKYIKNVKIKNISDVTKANLYKRYKNNRTTFELSNSTHFTYKSYYISLSRYTSNPQPQQKNNNSNEILEKNRYNIIIYNKYSIENCKKLINEIYNNYIDKEFTKFNKKTRYFFEFSKISETTENIIWEQYKFTSTKTFDNIYMDPMKKNSMINIIDSFTNNKLDYPKLSFLLYGIPGCGKTSLIKAIANYTNRHIINIDISSYSTINEIKKAFYNPYLSCMNRYNNERFIKIPLSKRVIVLEEIDTALDMIKKRSAKNEDDKDEKNSNEIKCENINLGTLLTIIDGVNELSGPILIITTNHPEKIDPALLRPGRVNMKIELGYMDKYTATEMIKSFYNDFDTDKYKNIINNLHRVLTPCKLEELCINSENISTFVKNIEKYIKNHDL